MMIKFFRHIRQTTLMKNQTGRYFKYAIGEIDLVVIGILIAHRTPLIPKGTSHNPVN